MNYINMAGMLKFHAYILASIGLHLTEALFRPPLLPANEFNRNENDIEEIEYLPNPETPMTLGDPWYSDSFEEIDADLFSPPSKKSQTLCRVRKIQKSHYEDGYEFHPKQYNEYECVPYEGDLTESSVHNLDICPVHQDHCVDVQKYLYYAKKKTDEMCWSLQRRVVKAGCKCIPPVNDICLANGSSCKTLEKKVVFGKKLSDSQCLITQEKVVKVGCNCIHHVKFHFP
ncbi:unnamed protein product [Callosobruchus maculatus]|uniref:Uncharacterized protein n=1 Tax=Callosobruchus maculatus TaxID=64391 RepID=A0A653DSE8_CALMS|nr:unnamed protein product [Callosobruchus maculatus]